LVAQRDADRTEETFGVFGVTLVGGELTERVDLLHRPATAQYGDDERQPLHTGAGKERAHRLHAPGEARIGGELGDDLERRTPAHVAENLGGRTANGLVGLAQQAAELTVRGDVVAAHQHRHERLAELWVGHTQGAQPVGEELRAEHGLRDLRDRSRAERLHARQGSLAELDRRAEQLHDLRRRRRARLGDERVRVGLLLEANRPEGLD
jgi:hypothetical protein